jgi:hypothetical protein
MSIIQNNAKIVSTCNQRITGLTKLVKTKTLIPINGEQLKLADLIGIYQAAIDTRSALVTSRAALEQDLAARDSAEVTRRAADVGLKAWITTQFGAKSSQAQELGFSQTKPQEKTAETKFVAVQKMLATREARGTKGKRQREKIKGTIVDPAAPAVPAVTVPAATPAAVTTATTPVAPPSAPAANGVAASH